METYKVIKFLHKLSEAKDYAIGDTIKLSKEEAEVLLKEKFVEAAKETKAKK
jgi:hypothetical protein